MASLIILMRHTEYLQVTTHSVAQEGGCDKLFVMGSRRGEIPDREISCHPPLHNPSLNPTVVFTNCLRCYPEGTLDREIPTSPSSPFLFTLPRRNLSCHSNPYQIKALHEFSPIEENGHFQKCQTFSIDSDQMKGLTLAKHTKPTGIELRAIEVPEKGCLVAHLEAIIRKLVAIKGGGEKRAIEASLQLLITQPTSHLSEKGTRKFLPVTKSYQKVPTTIST